MGEFHGLRTIQRSTSATLARLVQEKPNDAWLKFFLGLKLADEKNLEAAISSMHAALVLDPEFQDAFFYLGKFLFENRQFGDAREVLSKVRDGHPQNAERLEMLGEIALSFGETPMAAAHFLRQIAEPRGRARCRICDSPSFS